MMIRSTIKARIINPLTIALFIIGLFICPHPVKAEEEKKDGLDNKYGLAMVLGNSYAPTNNISFYMLSGSVLYDYEKVWHNKAPEPLRFKVEYNIGIAREQRTRLMTSMNMFALYYLNSLGNKNIMPYMEGGIGIIYTDFQIKGQGLKINFNPQMGIGAEFKTKSRDTYYMSFRLHHISNGGFDKENRGINSVLLMLGRYF
jgi:lipid A 3-O-deacylase